MNEVKRKTKNENGEFIGGPVFGEITNEKYLNFLKTSMFLDKLRFEIKRYLQHNYPAVFGGTTDNDTEMSILFGSKRFFFTYRYNTTSLFILDVADEDVLGGCLEDIISKKLGRQPEYDDDQIRFLMEDFPSLKDMDNWVEVSKEMYDFVEGVVEDVPKSKKYQKYGFTQNTILNWYKHVITTTRNLFISLMDESSQANGTFVFGLDDIQRSGYDHHLLFENGEYIFHPGKSQFNIEAELDIFSGGTVLDDIVSDGDNFEFLSHKNMIEMDPETLTPKSIEKIEEANPLDMGVEEIMGLIDRLIEENFKLKEEVHRLRNGVLNGVLNKIKKPLVDYFS